MAYTTATVNAWYQAVQFQNGPTATVNSWVSGLNAGTITPAQVQNSIITQDAYTSGVVNPVLRLYQSSFNSVPDQAGQAYWVGQFGSGAQTYAQIANGFANSTQFQSIYANTSATQIANTAQVTLLYQNILQRLPDNAGLAYWTTQTIGTALAGISSSPEMINVSSLPIQNFQAAEIAGTASGSGSLYLYPGFPVTTYNLTTAIESISPVANSVVNGTLAASGSTIQSFDSITGAGSNVTFNIADTTAVNFALPASLTLSGITGVNVNRAASGGGGTGAVIITNTTFGTGVQSLNYTESSAAADMTAATFSATLNSASTVTVAAQGAGVFTTVAVTDTSTTAAQTGSTLRTVSITGSSGAATLTGNAITTVNLNAAATGGTVTVTAAAGTRALTVNVSGTTNSGSVTDAQATSVTLNETSAAVVGTVTVAKATTVTINTTGTATTAGAETLTAATMTTLNFGGTRANTVTAGNFSALTSIVIGGSGGVTLGDLSAVTTLTSINTSTSTAVASASGAANLTVANSVTMGTGVAFTGGAGTDLVTVGATTRVITLGTGANVVTLINGTTGLGTGGSITGDGSDTLAFATAANAFSISGSSSLSTAFKAAVTGFNTVQLAAIGGATVALDVNALAATGVITAVNLTGNAAASALTISNLASNATIKVTGANTGATTTTAGTTGSGTSDVLNLSLSQGTAAAVSFATFVTPNVENINFIMADTQATPVGYYNTATLTNAALYSLNISGNSGLDLTLGVAATNLQVFNASGVTLGGVKFTSSALQFASTVTGSTVGGDTLNFAAALAATNITTTAGTNTVAGSSTVASTFTGGTGADYYFGGTGADTINAGGGADITYGNNAGAKQVSTVTYTTDNATANATFTVTIGGTAVVYTDVGGAANVTTIATGVAAAINANADLAKMVTATSAAGVVTLNNIVDGVISNAVAETSGQTTVATVVTSAGTSTTTGNDVITGGAGSDNFVFGISSAAPSATALQTVNDFNAGGTADFVFYTPTLATLATANATATAGVAAISASGIATFTTADQASLATELTAVAAGIQVGITAQGQSVAFQFGSDAYVFVSDAAAGVTAGDVLVKLTGISLTNTATDVLVASGHTLTLA